MDTMKTSNNYKKTPLVAACSLPVLLFSAMSLAEPTFQRNLDDVAGSEAHYDVKIARDAVGFELPGFEILDLPIGAEANGDVKGLSVVSVSAADNYLVTLRPRSGSMGAEIEGSDGKAVGVSLSTDNAGTDIRAVIVSMGLHRANGSPIPVAKKIGCNVNPQKTRVVFDEVNGAVCGFTVSGADLDAVPPNVPGSVSYQVRAATNAMAGATYSGILEYTIEADSV
ncbi:MAG: hypothetical protein OXC07_04795 [Kistimonas sp.]|nr:hypothetical protein [Kistimonas sp.]